jgi:hypothetical protein
MAGQAPCARSGHTLTACGGKFFLFGGTGRLDGELAPGAGVLHRKDGWQGKALAHMPLLAALRASCCNTTPALQRASADPHKRAPPLLLLQARRSALATCTSWTPATLKSTNGAKSAHPRAALPHGRATVLWQ